MRALAILIFLTVGSHVYAQKCKLQIHIEFRGIEDGYDHLCKDEIYFDDAKIKVTDERPESEAVDLTLKVKGGKHTFKIVNWTLYQGTWEETTINNDYSIDGFREIEHNFGKKAKISVVYDLDDSANSPIVTIE